jgi:hypothetical protein
VSDSDPQDPSSDLQGKDSKDKDLKPKEKTSGRVAFDSRGNAVWEWRMKTGVFGRDVDTGKLRTLEARDLEIAADPAAEEPTPEEKKTAARAARRTGFDPYNSTAPKPKAGAAPAKPAPRHADTTRRPGFFRRLFGRGD